MGLQELPNDIWLEITSSLTVEDILAVRRVSRRICHITKLRAIWQTVLFQSCIQYGVPRLAYQALDSTYEELEYLACRPSRFQALLTSLASDAEDPYRLQKHSQQASTSSNKSNRTHHHPPKPPPNPFTPILEYTLPGDDYSNIHLVNGGRWLLTMSTDCILKVWDLEPPGPSSDPTPNSSLKPNYSRPPRFTGSRALLYAQASVQPLSTFIDAYSCNDRHELYVFLRTRSPDDDDPRITAVCVNFNLRLVPRVDASPHPCHQVSTWTREGVSLDASWIQAYGQDMAVFSRRTTRGIAWIWDWRRDLTKKLTYLQVPTGADSLLCMKIVSKYLLAVHSEGPRKCTASLYELPSLDSDPLARPTTEFEHEPIVHSANLPPGGTSEPAEPLLAQFTSKFHGVHHVEAFRPKDPSAPPVPSTSPRFPGVARVTFVHRRSAMQSVPFNVGTVALSEPFWVVPPQPAITEVSKDGETPPPKTPELGSFRIAIGVESAGEVAWRSRLQYYLKVDLNGVSERSRSRRKLNQGDSQESDTSGDATISPPGAIPYPRLRGRVSAGREGPHYCRDRLFVASGKLTLLSVWSAPDGIHAHTSNVLKPEDRRPRVKVIPQDKRLFPSSVSVRVRPGQNDASSSRSLVPTAPEASHFKSLAPESYNEMGAEVIAYAWRMPEKVRPKPTIEEILEEVSSECSSGSAESLSRKLRRVYEPSRRDTIGNRLVIKTDLFSGRMVALDEIDAEEGVSERARTIVRVLEYV